MGQRTALGFTAHLGWACVAAVVVTDDRCEAIYTGRIETAPPHDRSTTEPYHVAGGFDGLARVPPPPNPQEIVEGGLARQLETTTRALHATIEQLPSPPSHAGVVTGRGKTAPTLERILASHAQIHIAEGNAVRTALADACAELGLAVVRLDGRELADLLARVDMTKPATGPWRKEERLCALAAWRSLS